MTVNNRDIFGQLVLTRSALLYIFSHDRKNGENLNRYRHDCIHHFLIRWYFSVDFETSREGF